MECTVCNARSQVDSCVQCQALLCEVCGETCEKCGEMACPDHTKRTSSGHIMCFKCYERRRAKKEARRQAEGGAPAAAPAGATGFQDLSGTRRPAGEEEERDEHAALTRSAQTNWPPWKISLLASIAGLIMVVLILIFSGYRRIPLAGTGYLPTSIFVIILAGLSGLWSAIGLASKDPEALAGRGKCFTGLGLAALAAILAVVAMVTDPARAVEEAELRRQQEQQTLTPEQRREQTRGILDQF